MLHILRPLLFFSSIVAPMRLTLPAGVSLVSCAIEHYSVSLVSSYPSGLELFLG